MCWRVEQRSDIGTFYYSSCVHDSYPVAHSCNDPKIVCDKDDGVSFSLKEGETLGIVGESGCGKTMTALSLLGLIPKPAARIVSGEILLDGEDLVQKSAKEMREIRGKKISMILQDPQTSLNPVFSIGNQVMEALGVSHKFARKEMVSRAIDALRNVRVAAPERRMSDYPHQMSGGMKVIDFQDRVFASHVVLRHI